MYEMKNVIALLKLCFFLFWGVVIEQYNGGHCMLFVLVNNGHKSSVACFVMWKTKEDILKNTCFVLAVQWKLMGSNILLLKHIFSKYDLSIL